VTAQGIDHLIVNSPFAEPRHHWAYDREQKRFALRDGRRAAGYVIATPGVDSFDDPAFALDRHPQVAAWAKNDHLGFEVHYLFEGGVHRFRPDFLIRLGNGVRLVLETKGQDTPKDRTKREFLGEWVAAVNEHGGFGRWACDVSFNPSDLEDVLARHA
jgi:hypothetical protein